MHFTENTNKFNAVYIARINNCNMTQDIILMLDND